MSGKLIVFSGPSGVGKGSIREKITFTDYVFSISSTTRQPRNGEVNGVEYHFITHEEFEKKIKNNEMLEYAEFCGNYYGTDRNVVQRLLDKGQNVMLEIECQGAMQVLEKMDDVLSIFILPPSLEELEKRLIGRNTEDRDTIDKRIRKAHEEIKLKDHYQYNIVNDVIEDVVLKLNVIFKKELHDE
ncbi:MAG: guanylate kinase [Mycoplasmatales bacterium]